MTMESYRKMYPPKKKPEPAGCWEGALGFLILFVVVPFCTFGLVLLVGEDLGYCFGDYTCIRKKRIRQAVEREYMFKMERRYNLR